MQKASVEAIVRSLNENEVRYLIVGGLAVVAHGYVRFTADFDVVVDFARENLERLQAALNELDYQPRAPIPFEGFLDSQTREQWVEQKNMLVFSLYSPQHPRTEVDIFIQQPFNFDEAYARSAKREVTPGIEAQVVGLDDLLELKRQAGRAQDLADIEELESLRGAT
jgi:predicted nucleotidyltransferase